jgi:hypothetical protein
MTVEKSSQNLTSNFIYTKFFSYGPTNVSPFEKVSPEPPRRVLDLKRDRFLEQPA